MIPLPERQKCDVMSIRLDTIPALDREKERQTEDLPQQYRALHATG